MLRQLRRHLAAAPLLRGRWWSRIGAVAVVAGLLAAPGAAYGSYQGRAYLAGDYFRGLHISGLGTHEMYAYYWPKNWVKNAGWVSDSFGDWIEAGQFVGTNKTGGCDASVAETVVAWWADWRPGSKYYCHVGGAMTEGANYGVTILQLSKYGTTWNVGSGGLAGRSTNSLSSANMIETGTTETSQASTSCSYSVALQWYDANENLHYGWHDSTHGNARIAESEPPGAYFHGYTEDGYPDWLRDYSPMSQEDCHEQARASALVSPPTPPPAPFAAKQIPALARSVGRDFGDPSPTLVEHAVGTRTNASSVMSRGDDTVANAPQSSYLVVMRGNFSSPAPTYPGEPASAQTTDHWTVEELVVDAATGQVTDSGGSNEYPNLHALGKVTTDVRTSRTG